MLGAILTNKAPVSLEQTTPIARLTGEYEVIVVPAASEIQTLDDLVAKFKADPRSVSWAGGSAGGTDHILVGLIAEQVGVEPSGVNYIAFRSEENTSELQSLMRISYAVFCLKKKKYITIQNRSITS